MSEPREQAGQALAQQHRCPRRSLSHVARQISTRRSSGRRAGWKRQACRRPPRSGRRGPPARCPAAASAPPTPSSRDLQHEAVAVHAAGRRRPPGAAVLAAFASASATTKYAAASMLSGSRAGRSMASRRARRSGRRAPRRRRGSPRSASTGGWIAADQVAHLGHRALGLRVRLVDQPRGLGVGPSSSIRARSSVIASATSRCCAPSCRSRSIRRRSTSKASISRAATAGELGDLLASSSPRGPSSSPTSHAWAAGRADDRIGAGDDQRRRRPGRRSRPRGAESIVHGPAATSPAADQQRRGDQRERTEAPTEQEVRRAGPAPRSAARTSPRAGERAAARGRAGGRGCVTSRRRTGAAATPAVRTTSPSASAIGRPLQPRLNGATITSAPSAGSGRRAAR